MSNQSILVDARLPWGSGIGRYVRNIVPQVASRLPETRLTLLVSPEDAERAGALAAPGNNITVTATDIRPFSLNEQVMLPALAAGYDVTWFTNYWVPLRWKGKFVATVHDLIHLDSRFPASALKRFAAARTFAKVRRDAAHVVFVSRFSARAFRAQVGAPRVASVVHHGIDHEGIAQKSAAARQTRDRTALVVAAAKEHKNLPMLLEAWRRARLDGWRLILVTPGGDLRSSIDLARQTSSIPGVEVRSGISDVELSNLYASVGFVTVPSRYEGFGLPLLEAMHAGAPVVSSTADALVEVAAGATIPFVAADDCDGWVEAIRGMAIGCETDGEWQRTVATRSRAVARSFTWGRAGARTAAILDRVLAGDGAVSQ